MPASLQLDIICLILALLSNAVLAVVVTQTPRMALASQTGTGLGFGLGFGGVGVEPPFFEQAPMLTNTNKRRQMGRFLRNFRLKSMANVEIDELT